MKIIRRVLVSKPSSCSSQITAAFVTSNTSMADAVDISKTFGRSVGRWGGVPQDGYCGVVQGAGVLPGLPLLEEQGSFSLSQRYDRLPYELSASLVAARLPETDLDLLSPA